METIEPHGSASTDTEHEPNFLLVRDNSGDWPRWKRAAVGSAIFHLFAITALFVIKGGSYEPLPPERDYIPKVTPLYIPKELTQKAPNKGPVAKLMMSAPSAPAPKLTEPPARTPRPAAPAPKPAPVPTPAPPIPAPVPPAPNLGETAKNLPPAASPPSTPLPRPDAPKMIVEDSLQIHPPAPKQGNNLNAPVNPIQEAMRSLANGGGSAPNRLGDSSDMSVGAGLQLPPSAARVSSFQLKSDPMGVDFQAYLQQVLARVKMNWAAVFPTAARLGQRGVVTLEFAVATDGTITKIVFDGQSGAKALDNASVAAISASNKLPVLPKEYKGDRIVLQLSFMYNMPK